MKIRTTSSNALIALVTLSFFVGCGADDTPDLVTVQGTLTKGGQPFADALLEFYPEASGGASYGKTDVEGKFTLYYTNGNKGAAIGRHSIQVTGGQVAGGKSAAAMTAGAGDAPSSMAAGGPTGSPASPARLTAEVVAGENNLTLAMP
jgi:hypothetical protein